jgi:hypothetical protein
LYIYDYKDIIKMKQPLNEQFRRMQQLAGIITESQFTEAESITIEKIEKGRDTGMAFGAIGAGYIITLSNGKTVKSDDEDLLERYKVIRDGRKDIDQLNTLLVGKSWDINESQINEKNEDLLSFIKQNQAKAADEVGAIRLEDIMIDDLEDVGATAIFDDDEGDEMRGGVAFRYSEDVDDDFEGENGDAPRPIEVAGKELMYISYNI